MAANRTTMPPPAATPIDPAKADLPCAEALVAMLTDQVEPGLVQMLKNVHVAEDTYKAHKAVRDGFDHNEAEDGWASLRYYLEHAADEVRRIVRAKN